LAVKIYWKFFYNLGCYIFLVEYSYVNYSNDKKVTL